MSQSFSFPPPPPPPPPPPKSVQIDQHNSYRQQGIGGQNRSRGSIGFVQRGRGYGHRGSFSSQSDGSKRGNHNNRGNRFDSGRTSYHAHSSAPLYQEQQSHVDTRNSWSHNSQKRSYNTAFQDQRPANPTSRPLAPPAVPSFGGDIDNLLTKKPSFQATDIGQARKQNLLGLTPASRGEESESDDEGEEVKLSGTVANAALFQFEYRGQTATLNSPAEIAAWIAERRKKWPTEAKREVAQQEADERRKKQDAERAAKLEASKIASNARQEEKQKQRLEQEKSQLRRRMIREQIQNAKVRSGKNGEGPNDAVRISAQIKAEKLRRKAEKIALQLEKVENRLAKQDPMEQDAVNKDAIEDDEDSDLENLLLKIDRVAEGQLDKTVVTENRDVDHDVVSQGEVSMTDEEETSSSGSSLEPDDGSGPEELSTRRHGPERMQQPSRKAVPDIRPICNNFAKFRRCKYGHRCHYRHEKPDRKAMAEKESGNGNRRKGLYQVMMEKEQEEERRKVLQVIVQLGEAGLLDDNDPAVSVQDGLQ